MAASAAQLEAALAALRGAEACGACATSPFLQALRRLRALLEADRAGGGDASAQPHTCETLVAASRRSVTCFECCRACFGAAQRLLCDTPSATEPLLRAGVADAVADFLLSDVCIDADPLSLAAPCLLLSGLVENVNGAPEGEARFVQLRRTLVTRGVLDTLISRVSVVLGDLFSQRLAVNLLRHTFFWHSSGGVFSLPACELYPEARARAVVYVLQVLMAHRSSEADLAKICNACATLIAPCGAVSAAAVAHGGVRLFSEVLKDACSAALPANVRANSAVSASLALSRVTLTPTDAERAGRYGVVEALLNILRAHPTNKGVQRMCGVLLAELLSVSAANRRRAARGGVAELAQRWTSTCEDAEVAIARLRDVLDAHAAEMAAVTAAPGAADADAVAKPTDLLMHLESVVCAVCQPHVCLSSCPLHEAVCNLLKFVDKHVEVDKARVLPAAPAVAATMFALLRLRPCHDSVIYLCFHVLGMLALVRDAPSVAAVITEDNMVRSVLAEFRRGIFGSALLDKVCFFMGQFIDSMGAPGSGARLLAAGAPLMLLDTLPQHLQDARAVCSASAALQRMLIDAAKAKDEEGLSVEARASMAALFARASKLHAGDSDVAANTCCALAALLAHPSARLSPDDDAEVMHAIMRGLRFASTGRVQTELCISLQAMTAAIHTHRRRAQLAINAGALPVLLDILRLPLAAGKTGQTNGETLASLLAKLAAALVALQPQCGKDVQRSGALASALRAADAHGLSCLDAVVKLQQYDLELTRQADVAAAAADAAMAALLAEEAAEKDVASSAPRKSSGGKEKRGAAAQGASAAAVSVEVVATAGARVDPASDDAVGGDASVPSSSASADRRRRRAAAKAAQRTAQRAQAAGGAAAGGGSADPCRAGAAARESSDDAAGAAGEEAAAAGVEAGGAAAEPPAAVATSGAGTSDGALSPATTAASAADALSELFPWLHMVPEPAPPPPPPLPSPLPLAPLPVVPPASMQPHAVAAAGAAPPPAAAPPVVTPAEKEPERPACAICLDATPCLLLLPCRHMPLCTSPACFAMLGAPPLCPLCRVGVADTIYVFV